MINPTLRIVVPLVRKEKGGGSIPVTFYFISLVVDNECLLSFLLYAFVILRIFNNLKNC